MSEVSPYFAERPAVPDTDSDEDMMWRKEAAITYDGGYISATYGNLAQTFNLGQSLAACTSKTINRKAYTADRTNTIGGDSKKVTVGAGTYRKYNRKNGSLAAGGEPFTFVTDIGEYTARVGGDVQDCIKWICDNRSQMFGTLTVYSGRGAQYGPFAQTSI